MNRETISFLRLTRPDPLEDLQIDRYYGVEDDKTRKRLQRQFDEEIINRAELDQRTQGVRDGTILEITPPAETLKTMGEMLLGHTTIANEYGYTQLGEYFFVTSEYISAHIIKFIKNIIDTEVSPTLDLSNRKVHQIRHNIMLSLNEAIENVNNIMDQEASTSREKENEDVAHLETETTENSINIKAIQLLVDELRKNYVSENDSSKARVASLISGIADQLDAAYL